MKVLSPCILGAFFSKIGVVPARQKKLSWTASWVPFSKSRKTPLRREPLSMLNFPWFSTIPREASTLIFSKIRSRITRTDLKNVFHADFLVFLRSHLAAQDRILKISVLASLGFQWFSTTFHDFARLSTTFHGFARLPTTLPDFARLSYTLLHRISNLHMVWRDLPVPFASTTRTN